ncbi:butyrophilin subfamily 2 member A1-like isoform X1 [Acipenser ruthenus]|uniref:butyrophilin subfamily 2 member A1-like isoform X1 n=2 Tax=Acipenser ruthenus TaxID=7906 RepID=UPI002741D7F7|nr:butyrophilin subfamily 2 member A1-like isoform X1 [Acipenser ruthenus]XP_058875435.1 butyrophilin subfamily 2 member A1-like isoform X1 [Acipenser ruthenus]XP_058875437.1 butyrophilin subfamily 2 member A1-like isoform X1 [Acipenser ruthenus]
MLPPEMKNHFLKSSGTILILFLKVCLTLAEKPVVVASKHPVIVFPGESVTLPCHLFPQASAVDLEVRWYRHRYNKIVHLYMFGRDVMNTQLKDYQGRTGLFKEELAIGNLSLQIKNTVLSDNGVYTCFAGDEQWDEQAEIELIVAVLRTQPSISMDSTQGEQTRLVCRSEGWYPEPEVIWRDRDGNDATSLSNTTVQRDGQGLHSVSSYIKIKQQSNVFSCLVRSKIPQPDWESKLHISSDFFPGVSGWMVAFFLTLALSIVAIPLLVIQWRRMNEMEKKYEPKAVLHLHKELGKNCLHYLIYLVDCVFLW